MLFWPVPENESTFFDQSGFRIQWHFGINLFISCFIVEIISGSVLYIDSVVPLAERSADLNEKHRACLGLIRLDLVCVCVCAYLYVHASQMKDLSAPSLTPAWKNARP